MEGKRVENTNKYNFNKCDSLANYLCYNFKELIKERSDRKTLNNYGLVSCVMM